MSTVTTQAGGASPVDFATYGDYGDSWPRSAPRRRAPRSGEFVRPPTRSRAGSRPTGPAATRPRRAATTCTSPGPARGRTGRPSCASCSAWRRSSRCRPWTRSGTAAAGRSARATATAGPGERVRPAARGLRGDRARLRRPHLGAGAVGPADRPHRQPTTSRTSPSTWTPSSASGPTRPTTCTPSDLRPEIDAINETVYAAVNNGVYRCGFATTQDSYHEAFTQLFARAGRAGAAAGRSGAT